MDRIYTEVEISTVAQELLKQVQPKTDSATVVGLSGELGAGKTTLVKALAEILGVPETVTSPTFVIAKQYGTAHPQWRTLIHIDAYRIEQVEELDHLGWESMLALPETLIIVEWPERIEASLPIDVQKFALSHQGESRHISII